MFYKGYTGSVEYSDEDGCLIGDVLGIRDSISFEGKSIEEIREDFHNAIDSYLESCEAWGKKPDSSRERELTVQLPQNIYQSLFEMAEETGKTVSAIAVDAFKAAGLGRGRRGKASSFGKAKGRKPGRKAPAG